VSGKADERAAARGRLDTAEAYHATLATLIHDLRGPVARVKAVAELLREEIAAAPPTSPEAETALGWLMIVNRATEDIDEVLESMLEAARNRTDVTPPAPDADATEGS
jgi:signal transduction histidine kinase